MRVAICQKFMERFPKLSHKSITEKVSGPPSGYDWHLVHKNICYLNVLADDAFSKDGEAKLLNLCEGGGKRRIVSDELGVAPVTSKRNGLVSILFRSEQVDSMTRSSSVLE